MSCNEKDRRAETIGKYVGNLEKGEAEGRTNVNKHNSDLIELIVH